MSQFEMNKSHHPERAICKHSPFGNMDVWEGVHKSPSCSVMAGNLSSSTVLPSSGVSQGSGLGSVIFWGEILSSKQCQQWVRGRNAPLTGPLSIRGHASQSSTHSHIQQQLRVCHQASGCVYGKPALVMEDMQTPPR